MTIPAYGVLMAMYKFEPSGNRDRVEECPKQALSFEGLILRYELHSHEFEVKLRLCSAQFHGGHKGTSDS